jgi:ABC-type dipeptide/oligopeptide/nickel transport system permease subunit
MSSEPWLGIFPGACIFVTVLCCNVLGEELAGTGVGPREELGAAG